MEACGLAPSRLAGPGGNGLEISFWESAIVRVGPDGSVTLQTGSCPAGQGHETTFAQIVADRLGAEAADVKVIWGDTDAVPNGMGTYGSRSITVGGEAAAIAADRVAAKAREIAAELLEASFDDVELADGRFAVRGSPDKGMALSELARGTPTCRRCSPTISSRGWRPRASSTHPVGATVRRPRRGRRGRHRDGRDRDPSLRRGRRLRLGHQPAARRGPGPRRDRPGDGSGVARAGSSSVPTASR